MSTPLVGDNFDYLFKMVVIGGTVTIMQTLELANLIYCQDFHQINLAMNLNQQLVYNLPQKQYN